MRKIFPSEVLEKNIVLFINPFVASAQFVRYGFLMFLSGRERVHWEQMGYGFLSMTLTIPMRKREKREKEGNHLYSTIVTRNG